MVSGPKRGLRAAKLQSNFPYNLLYAPLEAQGIGLKCMHTLQLIKHLKALVKHSDKSTLTGELINLKMQALKIFLGTNKPIWELNPSQWEDLCPTTWIKATWKDCYNVNIKITIEDFHTIQITGNDKYIMEIAVDHSELTKQVKRNVNWCR